MKRKNIALACLFAMLGIFPLLFFRLDDQYTELVFSKESGFYSDSFLLELYAPPGTEIYYTLDGSDPDENACLYTEPIFIEDATPQENVHAMRTDTSVAFLYGTGDGALPYVPPAHPVDKCTVVRAAYRDADGCFGESRTESYFIGYHGRAGYDGLNTISIVTAPENLFDAGKGIYVLGDKYDAFSESERSAEKTMWFWDANYRQRGSDWERPASIQLFDREGRLFLNQGCGLRIHGDASRGMYPKSFNLYARNQYGGNGLFGADLFDTSYFAEAVILDSGGNDRFSKMRDVLVSWLTKDRAFATMHFKPYAMFLKGEYWGVYWITEKYDPAYVAHYYDVGKKNVVMIKNGALCTDTEGDYALYTEMMAYMAQTDLRDTGNYQKACDMIDMQSYIDYCAVQIYISHHVDWPVTNEALWRTRVAGEGPYEDGRWRWMLFDTNGFTLSADLTDYDAMDHLLRESAMFSNLCCNDGFRQQFAVTFMDLVNTSFSEETFGPFLESYDAAMREPMRHHLQRFYGTGDSELFDNQAADIQKFLECRKPYAVEHLREHFNLSGALSCVTVAVNDKEAGSVIVNTVTPELGQEGQWSGDYFTDYPMILRAAPAEGYQFVRWESDVLANGVSDEETIEVTVPEDGMHVRAVFERNNFQF